MTDSTGPDGAAAHPDAAELEIVFELETSLLSGEVRRSPALLEDLLDPEFCEIGASGRLWTRAEMLRQLPSMPPGASVEATEMEGTILGEDLVLVRYLSVKDGRRARRSSLWRRSAGSWRIVFHQGTLA